MNPISIPPIAMATLVFYVGFYHFLIYRRQKENRENLTFALTCFTVGLYAFCCAGLYNVSSPEVGVEWQRLQGSVLAIFCISLLWFINDYTGHTNKKIVIGFTVYYIFAALTGLLIRSDLTWSSVPSIKEVWLPFGYNIIYNEMEPGTLISFQSIVGLFYFIYIITVGIRFYRSGNKKKGSPLLIAIAILCAGLINDTSISSGLYDFIYMLEYSYIGMILVFTFFLTTKVIKAGEIKTALRQSEESYRLIAENVSDVIWTMDMNLKSIYVSPSIYQQRGYTVKEAMEKPLNEMVLPESLKKTLNLFAEKLKCIESGDPEGWEPVIFEIEQYCKDGTIMWTSNNARILIGPDKQPTSILGVTRDITDRVLAEYEVKESETKYRNLYSNAQVGLARTSFRTGKILTCNDKMAQIFNYESTDDFINEFVFSENYVNPDLRESLINKMKKTEFLNNVEAEFYGKDKSKIWARFDIRSYYDKGYMEDVVVDMTELRIREEALQESQNRFRDISLSMADWIWETDKEIKFTYLSQSIKDVLGYSPEELIGKTPFDIMPEEESNRIKLIANKIVSRSEHIKDLENWNIHKDGQKLFMLTNGIPILDNEGKTQGYRGVNRNITTQRKLETQLQQAQKMESIGTLAGGIAHDFNNILFPILGHAEMLLTDIPEDSPFRNDMKAIHVSALRAKDLVKQILTFSRQDANELKLMKIQPIVKEALKLIRSTIPTTIEIKQDINADCGAIKADPTQIHQIVMNLTTNAYHAMEETGGELKVSLKQIKLEPLDLMYPKMAPGVYACLIVADTGAGMDKNVTDKIFDPFFTTKAIGKGTGMGLSVVHGIVTSLEGAIQVYSEQGKGTKFHVYFPIEKNSLKKLATHSKTQIQGGTEQILLVDDEEAILTMEKQMLERLGYQVTSRVSSLEALEAFRANPGRFDIVITDMAMPNMAGDKLSDELTKIRTDIPVLLCTGFSETMSEEKATSLGIKGFIFKPIVMQDFAQKIREVLNKNKSDEAN